ncbi:MAG: tetratricopeptide repeat protein, partial [Dolichospermum sp.]
SHIGDTQGAIEDYNQAIKLNPDYATTQKDRQIARYLLDDKNQLQQVIHIDSDHGISDKNRGHHRAKLGDYQGAIDDYTQAILNGDDMDIDAYYYRGNSYFELGKYAAAISDYTQVIKMNYHYINAYYNRGNARLEIGDKQGAVADFHKAADLYWQEGKLAEYQDTQARIIELEIEASLDILNF